MRIDSTGAEPKMITGVADFTDMRVLEVGSGDGRMTSMLSGQAKSVLSIDPDEDAIALAIERDVGSGQGNVEHRVADVCAIKLRSGEFDAVFLALSL